MTDTLALIHKSNRAVVFYALVQLSRNAKCLGAAHTLGVRITK